METSRNSVSGIGVSRASAGQALCRVVGEIHTRGWCMGTGGNFSVTLDHQPMRILVTQSGRDKRRIGNDDLVIVGRDGAPIDGETGRPSAETQLHASIVAATGASSTLHTHSVPATLLSEHFLAEGGFTMTGYAMMKGLEGIRTHRAEVFVPVLPNAQDMHRFSDEVDTLLAEKPRIHGFLIAGHGLYTWGTSLQQAHRHVEIFEFLFECLARRTRFRPFV